MVLRLEVLALHKYIELIKQLAIIEEYEFQREASKIIVQKIGRNFGEVKGLAAVMVSGIYWHSKAVFRWETMRKVLEHSLQLFEDINQKYYTLEKGNTGALTEDIPSSKEKVHLKEVTLVVKDSSNEIDLSVYPKCIKYKHIVDTFMSQMLTGDTVNPVEKMLVSFSLNNIKEACTLFDSQAKEISSNCSASRTLSLKNEMLRTIEELESITNEVKSTQVIKKIIKEYLDTGPYKTWKEMQVDFLRYLIQQPMLHLFANQLSESLICFYINEGLHNTSLERQKMMIEACLHPAVTKLNANDIPVDILLQLLPKLQDLNTLKVKTKITGSRIFTKDAQVLACMSQYCSKLKCLCITFQLHADLTTKAQTQLGAVLACLPTTLISIRFYGLKEALNVKFLDEMAASGKFSSLHRLTLSGVSSTYPLQQSLRNLVSVEVLYTQLRGNELFRNVGGQLKQLSLSCVVNIEIGVLAECCPSLESLSLKHCLFLSSFHTEPLPTFSSLKEIFFITPTYFIVQESAAKNICIWCILQNSPEIEKLVVVTSVAKFGTCFQKLVKTNQMRYLQEFELYKHDRNICKGLIKRNFAVHMVNKFPTLSFIGGIDHAITQRNLSEVYSNKTFVCIHEKIMEHIHEPNSEFGLYLSESDDSDLDDI